MIPRHGDLIHGSDHGRAARPRRGLGGHPAAAATQASPSQGWPTLDRGPGGAGRDHLRAAGRGALAAATGPRAGLWQRRDLLAAGYGTGNTPGCGTHCIIGCWTGWAMTARSTGRGRRSIRSACGLGVGGADGRESGRPGQGWLQVPPADRRHRDPAGGGLIGRQHPRLPAPGAAGGRGPGGHRATRTAGSTAQATGQAARR
jgi:hypothetical protein